MRATFSSPLLYPRRGGEVKVGNVYSHMRARYYKVVIGLGDPKQRWNCVTMIHVDATGETIGASCQPIPYVRDHQDLVGFVKEMPSIKIEWSKK